MFSQNGVFPSQLAFCSEKWMLCDSRPQNTVVWHPVLKNSLQWSA